VQVQVVLLQSGMVKVNTCNATTIIQRYSPRQLLISANILPHKSTKAYVVTLCWTQVENFRFKNVWPHCLHEAHWRHHKVSCTNQLQRTHDTSPGHRCTEAHW